MIALKLRDKQYYWPTDWSELPLGKYQSAMELISNDDKMDTNIKLLCLISGIPEEDILDLPYTTYNQIQQLVGELLNLKQGDVQLSIKINDIEYAINQRISDYTTGEFIDLDTLVTDQENVVFNLHTIMAILYRKVIGTDKRGKYTEPYNWKTVEERAILFQEKMPCDIVFSALFFSTALEVAYLETIAGFSAEQTKEKREKLEKMIMNLNLMENQTMEILNRTGPGI